MTQMTLIVRERASTELRDATDLLNQRRTLFGRVRLFFDRRRADAMLRRTIRPFRLGSTAPLTPHLLKDIGLPPDFRM